MFFAKIPKKYVKTTRCCGEKVKRYIFMAKGEIVKGKTPEKLQAAAKKSLQSYRKRG